MIGKYMHCKRKAGISIESATETGGVLKSQENRESDYPTLL